MTGIKRYTTLAAMVFGVMMLLYSCTKEDLSVCPPDEQLLSIGFENVKPSYENEVDRMDVLIFGANGILYKVLSESGISLHKDYTIQTQLSPGDYRLVSWSDLGCHYKTLPETFVPGVTTFHEATMMLDSAEGSIINSDLHTSLFGTVQISVGGVQTRSDANLVKIPLQQNSYRINLTVEGVYDHHNYTVTIADDNGSYNFDNQFVPCQALQYTKGPLLSTGGEFATSLTTLRLERNRTPQFTITDNTVAEILLTKDLITLILAVEESAGVTVDFSTEHEFDIHIKYDQTTLTATITVNGWEVSLGNQEELG